MERSLKEALAELEARLQNGAERHFPVMGFKGAAGPLMLREAALALKRPILAVTPLASEAETLAAEWPFFWVNRRKAARWSARCICIPDGKWLLSDGFRRLWITRRGVRGALRVAAQTGAAGDHLGGSADDPDGAAARFESSVLNLTLGDHLDLEGVVSELAAIGYQRLPQTEEPGDFSVRGGIVDLFSPLYSRPLRLELEDDVLSSIRFFDPADQRSLGEVLEAIVIPARFIPPGALRDKQLRDRVELRAAEIGLVRKEVAELTEALESGLLFPGVENLLPYMFDEPLDTLFDFLPEGAITWLVEPGRIIAQAQRFADRIADEAEQNQSRHAYFPPRKPCSWTLPTCSGGWRSGSRWTSVRL